MPSLGHEQSQPVQQGRERAATQAKGVGINDRVALEGEGDEIGTQAARGDSAAASMVHKAAPASVLQCKPVEGTGQDEDSRTRKRDGDAPPKEDGLSPRARAVLHRLRMQPQLPPEVMAKLSQGLEQIAEQAASLPGEAMVGEKLSLQITESDWQLALHIGVDPQTGTVQIALAFKDGDATGFIGSFSTTSPQAMKEAALDQRQAWFEKVLFPSR